LEIRTVAAYIREDSAGLLLHHCVGLTRQASAGRRSSLGGLSPAGDSPHLSTVRAQSARLTVIDAFSGLIRLRHHDTGSGRSGSVAMTGLPSGVVPG
jgi:hypothetical protein